MREGKTRKLATASNIREKRKAVMRLQGSRRLEKGETRKREYSSFGLAFRAAIAAQLAMRAGKGETVPSLASQGREDTQQRPEKASARE